MRCGDLKSELVNFLRYSFKKKGFKKAVIGVSGGIDSACVAYLAVEALGSKNVLGVILPYKTTGKADIKDAKLIIKTLGIKSRYIEITDMVDAYFKKIRLNDNIRRGNKMARERMSILYDLSKEFNGLVVGTGNRTETLLGYGTIHGDVACAINPLSGLFKTQVRKLAECLGVPESVRQKAPSAGLWQGQTDEGELGFKYSYVDKFLNLLIDKKFTQKQLLKSGYSLAFINKVKQRIEKNKFKSEPALVSKIG